MAVGDITYDTGWPRQVSNWWEIRGVLSADTTLRGFALGGTKIRLLSCEVVSEDEVATARVVLNDSAGTATNGSISVDGEAAGDYRFIATYV